MGVLELSEEPTLVEERLVLHRWASVFFSGRDHPASVATSLIVRASGHCVGDCQTDKS